MGAAAPGTGAPALGPAERRRLEPLAGALARAETPDGPRLELVAGTLPSGARASLLAGTFNPLTRAHAALAVAAHRAGWGRVVLAIAPASLDKERLQQAHPLDRLDWARLWARGHDWAAVAVSSHPLLVDMAEALGRLTAGPVALLLGADKAVQLVEPRYYEDLEAALARLRKAASLLVADRAGHPTATLPLDATRLPTPAWALTRSSTEARAAARRGDPLDPLVPTPIARAIARTHAYDDDPAPYLARSRELDGLVASART